ncbi:U8 snoRNA-decapping enzyme-like protein [Dinothrombium tinctorium]|uniref:U8 snoRNA-decapping enzyme n=1 Tax=Dinothrombium tinctorium TaxID=1965070 RepID=A0A443RK58_9ACAR|nr:U8 snoRNA-decapping enzyme-like protein [Dinothrombium tinctorium]
MEEYIWITLPQAIEHSNIPQAAHCFLWFRDEGCSENADRAYVLMQMRSDGMIGFPGGYIDECIKTYDEILLGLNRELKEEIDYSQEAITIDDYICSHKRNSNNPLIVHFFAKKLTKEQFESIEKSHTRAMHFSIESLGLFRVPIALNATIRKEFLSNFLQNQFAGNSKRQFLYTLFKLNLINESAYNELSRESKISYE